MSTCLSISLSLSLSLYVYIYIYIYIHILSIWARQAGVLRPRAVGRHGARGRERAGALPWITNEIISILILNDI